MSDTTVLPGTGDRISTDDLATLNGAAVTTPEKVQRVKVGYGADGDFRDVDTTHGLPVGGADFGLMSDAAATSDSGTFSLIAFFKRLLAKIPGLGSAAPSSSLPVTIANNVSVSGGLFASGAGVINLDLLTGTVNGWLDAANFRSMSVQITTGTISTGVVTFEQTNDTTQSSAGNLLPILDSTQTNGTVSLITSQILSPNVSRIYATPITCRYVRARISVAVSGGTVQGTAILSQLPYATPIMTVNQATGSNLNVTASLATGSNGVVEKSSSISSGSTLVKVRATAANPPSPVSLKAGASNLLQYQLTNFAAYTVFVKFYGKASAPLLASDVPALIIPIPAGATMSMPQFAGIPFTLGLGWVITKGIGDTDATAVAADDVVGHFLYI